MSPSAWAEGESYGPSRTAPRRPRRGARRIEILAWDALSAVSAPLPSGSARDPALWREVEAGAIAEAASVAHSQGDHAIELRLGLVPVGAEASDRPLGEVERASDGGEWHRGK